MTLPSKGKKGFAAAAAIAVALGGLTVARAQIQYQTGLIEGRLAGTGLTVEQVGQPTDITNKRLSNHWA